MSTSVYAEMIPDQYAARVDCIKTYDAVSRDIIERLAFPVSSAIRSDPDHAPPDTVPGSPLMGTARVLNTRVKDPTSIKTLGPACCRRRESPNRRRFSAIV